jgi:ribosomal protein L1
MNKEIELNFVNLQTRTKNQRFKMATTLPEDYETSIRVIAFKGKREKWRQRKIKTKAIGTKRK